ncbi:MAG: hypothetical protein ACFFD4_33895 [Candidatus Odinarchaeota archaeon]
MRKSHYLLAVIFLLLFSFQVLGLFPVENNEHFAIKDTSLNFSNRICSNLPPADSEPGDPGNSSPPKIYDGDSVNPPG